MKTRLLTLALVVLTTISPSEESRSSSDQGRGVSGWKILSGPVSPVNLTGPKRYAAEADPALRRAMATLSARNGHAVQYRFSGNQSHPVQVRGFRSRRYNGSAESQARAFLREHQDLVGTSGSEGELFLRSIRESATGNHVRFQSGRQGIPVHGSFVSVHLNHSGEAVMVNNISPARQPGNVAQRVEKMQAARITDQEAISRAMSSVGVRSLRLPPDAVRVIVAGPDPADSMFSAAWKVQLAAADPVDIDLFVRRDDAVAVGGDGVIVADARAQSALGTEAIVLSDKTSPILRPGVYYVAIVNFSTSAASYELSATSVRANPVEGEFPQSGELVTRTIPASPDGSLWLDPVQFAFVTSVDSALLQVDLVASRPAEIQLYARFGGKVLQSSSGGIVADLVGESLGGEEHFLVTRASVPALRTGEYFFAVGTSEPEPVEYTLRITVSTTSLSDKLYFPFYINGRESALGSSSFFIGLAILNDSDEIAIANFELLGPDGKRIADPAQRLLLVGEQIPVTVNQLFGLPDDHDLRGWVEVTSNVPLKGFFLLFDSDFSQVMDGADVSDKTSTTLVFPHVERHGEEFNTVISLCNPGEVAATATYQEFNPAGQKVFSEVIVVPARGSFIGGTTGFDRASGFVKVISDVPLAGVEVFGNDRELAALKAVPPGTSHTLFYPHFVINRGYDTLFSLSNPTDVLGQVFILAFREDGDLLVQTTKDMGPNSQVVASINSLFGIEPDDLVQVGFIKIQSNIVKELVGFAKINFTEGDITSTAAIPASNSPQKTLTFSHVANDVPSGRNGEGSLYTTGITLMADDTDASYDVIVYDNKGNRVIQSNPFLLPKGKKVSKVLAGSDLTQAFISQTIVAGSGYVKVRSNIPIYGFELFFTRDLTLNSAVPPQ